MKIDWIEIPAGEFLMGLSPSEAGRLKAALHKGQPLHNGPDLATEFVERRVHLDIYWISRTPITYRQMNEFVASGHPYADPWGLRKAPNFSEYPMDHPEPVLWQQAHAFCSWMNARLPTSAEWEKAARGTDGRLYPWGNTWNEGRGNFGRPDSRGVTPGVYTSPVGLYPEGASPFGMLDALGNAREWTGSFEYDPGTTNEVPVVKGTCAREETEPLSFVHRVTRHRAGSLVPENAPPYTSFRPVLDRWQRQFWTGLSALGER